MRFELCGREGGHVGAEVQLEQSRVAQLGQFVPRRDERVLHHVVDVGRRAQQPRDESPEVGGVPPHDHGEGELVAVAGTAREQRVRGIVECAHSAPLRNLAETDA